MEWIKANWPWIAGVGVPLLMTILNAITRHWSEHKGLVKVLQFVVEVLSLATSAGTLNGRLGRIKLPVQSVPPPKKKTGEVGRITTASLVLLLTLAVGCGGPTSTLKKVHTGIDGVINQLNKRLHKQCYAEAKKCESSGVREAARCKPWVACDKTRARVNAGAKLAEDALIMIGDGVKFVEVMK